jgi:ATP-dependent Clp protease ATP-binding subunit ClpC
MVIAKITGIPLARMERSDNEKLLNIENELRSIVVGQEEGVTAMAKALRRSRADLRDPKRPIASFLFLGPTGVGKTLLAKAIAEIMFGDREALLQFDMSEYMEKFNVSRLVGSPPGYVGYDEGGQLTEQVRRRPYCVVLFDEIEKAHPDVTHILLQVLEEGKVTDSLGRKVDFRNTIVILTSNVGADLLRRQTSMGFGASSNDSSYDKMKEKILEETKKLFKPEFINRLDDLIVFRALNKEDVRKIVDVETTKVQTRLKRQRDLIIELSAEAKDFLVDKGYEPALGARPLRRAIERYLEDPLAEELLRDAIHPHEKVMVYVAGDKLVFRQAAPSQIETP